jgi:hypothetical protein
MMTHTPVRLRYFTDAGDVIEFSGLVLLSSIVLDGNQDQFSMFDKVQKGSGPYTLTKNGTPIAGLARLAAPSLTATAVSETQINLSWINVANELSYELQVSTDNVTYSALSTLAANATTYNHTGLSSGSKRYYRIRAIADGTTYTNSNWAYSNATTGIGVTIQLSRPNFFADTISSSAILLQWTNVDNEVNYVLERSLNGSSWSSVASPAANVIEYTNTGLSSATRYFYRLKAVGDGVFHADSLWAYADATTLGAMLTQLATPVLSASSLSASSIALSWTNVANESGYQLQRSPSGQNSWTTIATPAANATSYNDTGLSASTTYDYRIKATGDNVTYSDSAYSTASATTSGAAPVTFLAEWGWDADPLYGAISGGTNPTPVSSASFNNGSAINADTRTMPADHYLWVRYPNTESDKTSYFNTTFNQGTIGGFEFHEILTSGGYKYIIARNPVSFDNTAQTTFS